MATKISGALRLNENEKSEIVGEVYDLNGRSSEDYRTCSDSRVMTDEGEDNGRRMTKLTKG